MLVRCYAHTYSYSSCMERTAALCCYLPTYHRAVTTDSERRDPGYNRYPAARRYVHQRCPPAAIYTYKLLGSLYFVCVGDYFYEAIQCW